MRPFPALSETVDEQLRVGGLAGLVAPFEDDQGAPFRHRLHHRHPQAQLFQIKFHNSVGNEILQNFIFLQNKERVKSRREEKNPRLSPVNKILPFTIQQSARSEATWLHVASA